jgi:hypothetical protein
LILQCRGSCSQARASDSGNSSHDNLEIHQPYTMSCLRSLVGLERSKELPQYVRSISVVKLIVTEFYDFMRASVPRSADP